MSIQSTDSSRSWFCVLNIHCLYVKDDSELFTQDVDEKTKEKCASIVRIDAHKIFLGTRLCIKNRNKSQMALLRIDESINN